MGSEDGLCQHKGVMDRSLVLRMSVVNFPDEQRQDVAPPCRVHDWCIVQCEQDLRERRDTIDYVHRVFFVIQLAVRGVWEHMHMDMTQFPALPTPPDWAYDGLAVVTQVPTRVVMRRTRRRMTTRLWISCSFSRQECAS